MEKALITIDNCRIENSSTTLLHEISWEMKDGEVWLVIGPNGGGKADFLNALSGIGGLKITPNTDGLFSDIFYDSTETVSLERAARLIQEERENDESDYIEGGVDHGRTGRVFISQALTSETKLENEPAVKLCGIEKILDRGLKYMSTGEIRRTLLARALLSGKQLLILSDPFAGLDVQSRTILLDFFDSIARKKGAPQIILGMERWHEIPDAITHVLEFTDKKISFSGTRADYEKLLSERENQGEEKKAQDKRDFEEEYKKTVHGGFDTPVVECRDSGVSKPHLADILVEMHDVNVGWDGHQVLRNLNWTLVRGEHWLVRGPNGSGKTTFLELITGDNMQVFSNDIRIFGNRRGSGETIWDIKKRLGIAVSSP